MELISAKEAKKLYESTLSNELEPLMAQIIVSAKSGKTVLHVYNRLSDITLKTLKELGYEISDINRLSVQRDGLHHSIYWK